MVLHIITFLVMVIGVVGTVFPVVPGLTLICVTAVFYGIISGFDQQAFIYCGVIMGIVLAASAYSILGPTRRANRAGANRWSIGLGFFGAVTGAFVIPVIGLPLGGVIGIYVAELLQGKQRDAALQSTVATLKGMGIALLVEFFAGMLCLAVWLVWAFWS